MAFNVQTVIQAISRAAELSPQEQAKAVRKPIITISRDHGSGGDEIAEALAERLGIDCYGKEVLNAVAKRAEVNESLLRDLHEKVTKASDSWLYSVVFGKNVARDDYVRDLVTVIRGLYRVGGIILGRGGHVILAGRDVLRVRIIGTPDACARRIAHLDHIDLKEAKKEVVAANKAHDTFVWEMFRTRLSDASTFDIVINTDHFADYGQVVDILMNVVTMMGLDKPKTGTSRK
ncbi:MAG: cytidylate kinase-like family protein [Rhodospirillales bacterium]|nr:cytidylate kinase-like family protein [Rhodospirillales bacterium]